MNELNDELMMDENIGQLEKEIQRNDELLELLDEKKLDIQNMIDYANEAIQKKDVGMIMHGWKELSENKL